MSATAAERVANTLTLPMVAALHAAAGDGLCRDELSVPHPTSWVRGDGRPCTRTAMALCRRGLIERGVREVGQRHSRWQVTGLGEQVLACLPERRAET